MTDKQSWKGNERRSSNVDIRELLELERRITAHMRDLEQAMDILKKESVRFELLAKQYNDIRDTQIQTMEMVRENRQDLNVLCQRDDWWATLKGDLGWIIALVATTLAIGQYLGFIG